MSKLLIFAGPNGSGKSTVTDRMQIIGNYVNADLIKAHLQCDDLKAAQIAEETREYLLKSNADFTFETVLSTPRNLNLILRAKEKGYYIICIYILTRHPEINIKRVKQRVAEGGHNVTDDKVVTRYHRCLSFIPDLLSACNELYIFDNSKDRSEGEADMIASLQNGMLELKPTATWSQAMLESLVSGKYSEEYMFPN